MADFNGFSEETVSGIARLAEDGFNDFKDEAIAAGKDFLAQSKEDLQHWTEQLAAGQISKEDFEWLMRSKENAVKLIILNRIGLTKTQADKLTAGIISVVTASAFKLFKK